MILFDLINRGLDYVAHIIVGGLVAIHMFHIIITPTPLPTIPVVTEYPKPTVGYPTIYPQNKIKQTQNVPSDTTGDWGVAKQIDEHTWTMKVGQDSTMATPQDIFVALNNYRSQHGVGTLQWDQKLADYAQSRANLYITKGDTDEHAGFNAFVQDNGFQKLGFHGLGENSSIGLKLIGVHIIEWMYASDAPHNNNQLDPKWSYVGIGVSGTATDLVFGGDKY